MQPDPGDAPATRPVCHPVGAKVITAIKEALDLPPGLLHAERNLLRHAGNISATTVLFVPEEVLAHSPWAGC